MADNILSPYMNLPVPIVGGSSGPQYAIDIDSCMTLIDAHNHTPGYGVQIPPAGLNINSDLTFQDNNAINLRSARFFVQPSVLSGASDLDCVYVTGVDLYYNDGNGNQVRLTQGGSVAAANGSISGLVPPASASYSVSGSSFIWQSNTNKPAFMDNGPILLRNFSVGSHSYEISPPSSLPSDVSIQLPVIPGSTQAVNMASSGIMGTISYDGIGQAMTSVGADAIANSRTRPTGTTVAAGGVGITPTCGVFTVNNAAQGAVTNFNITITTSGRPVVIQVIDDSSLNASTMVANFTSSGQAFIQLYRGLTQMTNSTLTGGSGTGYSIPSTYAFIDFPSAGTYNYQMYIQAPGTGFFQFNYLKMVAYEL